MIEDTFQVMAPVGRRKQKFQQKVASGKERSGGGTPASMRCFKCGESGYRVAECKSADLKYFKCRRAGHCIVECRSNSSTCFNCGEQGHISNTCQKPNEAQSRREVLCCLEWRLLHLIT